MALAHGRNKKMRTKKELGLEVLNNKDYKFFVLDNNNNILSGWEYKEDAKDSQQDEIITTKVYSRKYTIQLNK